ncbi:phage N-6-adenine-methyltransferase [Morganella morganii]|uniref:phage N-6-adenine-methyltransferase n=1 Tax=Morganella morganii TaxID=582 RepID=UPI00298D787A|nr:phage N-6-adenine-methyltransferase [Morganella morganii]MDW7794226.1 phage N-6-adenine-methyltransferase [Morganella morganii]
MMSLTYGSVCSGIEAASVAWEPVGMKPLWFSEIEPFPSAVLAAHWPQVDNLGDMTKLAAAVRAGDVPAPDLLVGGTPCQAFSVAGLRGGLSDERGQLTLSYVELADSIDEKREQNGEQPAIIVWENVPGVLSSKDNAFGCFLAGLVGESEELKPAGEKWTNVGYVSGPKRTIAWRILDAQYFGVAQRRRRVFVVASARTDICPAEILFECDSLHGDIAPGGEAEKEITGTLTARTHGGGGLGTDFECNGGLVPVNAYRMLAFGEYSDDGTASTVKARDYKDATDLAVTYPHNTVRRLTPVECERLQGFPDNHTLISWRGKDAADCPDGPRYRAIGNSMAVPVMRWIGERILAALPQEETPDLRSDYVIELEELCNKPAHMLKEVGDQWRSPDPLYWGINAKFGPFTLDLFTDGQNSKCPDYYTAEDNALTQDWSEKLKELGGAAYGNPPYSRATYHGKQAVTGMVHIMEYAKSMREKGGRYVFLLKAATSETWWPEWADHVAFIRGRIGFDLPDWFVPANEKQKPSGAFFAGAVVILDKDWQGDKISYISRDELIAIGELFMQQAHWLVEKTGEAA